MDLVDSPLVPCLGLSRQAITLTVAVVAADRGKTFDATSGTFAVNFAAAATLGSGWHCIVYNSGAGTVTLTANGAETIRSLTGTATTYALSQGSGVVVVCTGTGLALVSSTGSTISGLTAGRIVNAASANAIETAASISTTQTLTTSGVITSSNATSASTTQLGAIVQNSGSAATSASIGLGIVRAGVGFGVGATPTAAEPFTFSATYVGQYHGNIRNNDATNGSRANFNFINDSGNTLDIGVTSSGTSGGAGTVLLASTPYIFSAAAAGLGICSQGGPILLGAGAGQLERARVTTAGNLLIGATADTGLTGSGGLRVASTTSASSSIVGAIVVGDAATAATCVGIGGGNINAGGALTVGGVTTLNGGAAGCIVRNATAASYADVRLYNDQNSALRSLSLSYSGSTYVGAFLSGTNAPTGEQGVIATTGAYPLVFGTGNAYRAQIDTSGTLWIDNATIAAVFRQSVATGYVSQRWYNDQNSAVRALDLGYTGSAYASAVLASGIVGESGYVATTGNYPMQLGTSNTARITITGAGVVNVLNTTSASSATVGAVTIGNGVAATNVAIGAGKIHTGDTITAGSTIIAPAATTSIPSVRMPHGTAPSAPTNGDWWTTTAGAYVRINGATVGPLVASSGAAIAAYWAKISSATDIAITTTVTATVNRMHIVSGTAGNYTITMPVAVAGDVVGFAVREYAAADDVYLLDAGVGVGICGRTRYLSLVHTNVALLYYDGTRWLPLVLELNSPWVDAGVISLTASTTNPTKGTTTTDKLLWCRSGGSMHCIWHYVQTVAGAAGSGTYILGLPHGIAPATTLGTATDGATWDSRIGTSGFGNCMLTIAATASFGDLFMRSSTGTGIGVTTVNITGAAAYLWNSTTFQLSNAAVQFFCDATFPVTDW